MNIVICDDEKMIREDLKRKVENMYPADSVYLYGSGEDLLRCGEEIQILFLDIEMPGINGMETARSLRQKYPNMVLVFVTALREYVFQAFDVGAFHYLVKPFSDVKFFSVLKKAHEEAAVFCRQPVETGDRQCIMVYSHGVHRKVFLENIVYAEVFNRKVMIHETEDDFEYYGKLTELEQLAGDSFFRTHRSYLINMKYVERYDGAQVTLTKGEVLIAKAKYAEFVKAFLKYHKKRLQDGI